jgi:two-component system, OmpR family, alkaline phosphatase synthesis response regulator PhoP
MACILIVEDNQKLLKLNTAVLEKAGYDVEAALNGEAAITIMDKKKIDLLLLDLLTPKVNGFGVMQHARKMKYGFPIIVLTNLNERIDRKQCIELGAADFLIKSDNDLPDLAEKVKTYLGK